MQLDDGMDIMCVEYDTGKEKTYIADMINSKNKGSHFDSFDLKSGKTHWRSENTKAEYPLEWSIEIPEAEVKLQIKAIIKDQEMIFGSINYWEGPINIVGTSKGKKVKGIGFMELVGFPSDYNRLVFTGKEFSKKITSQIKKLF
jgi:predicted secreted hydrolase